MQLIEERQQAALAELATKQDIKDLRSDMRFYFLAIGGLALIAPSVPSLLQFIVTFFK